MSGEILSIALVADGGSDRALLPILEWSIRRHRPAARILVAGFLARRGADLSGAMHRAAADYVPDLLFVHRDAEGVPLDVRRREIPVPEGLVVRVVPVRMTEAWLLIDEHAIRRASGNPSGTEPLELPAHRRLEDVPDPKRVLRELLIAASGRATARRLKRLRRDLPTLVQRVSALIEDFSPLVQFPAFRAFEAELVPALDRVAPPPGR